MSKRKVKSHGLFTAKECSILRMDVNRYYKEVGKKTGRRFRTAYKQSSNGNTCLSLNPSVTPADLGFGPRKGLPIVHSMTGDHKNQCFGELSE